MPDFTTAHLSTSNTIANTAGWAHSRLDQVPPNPPKRGAAGVGHPPAAFTIKLGGGKYTEGTYWLKDQPESTKIASHIRHTRTEHS